MIPGFVPVEGSLPKSNFCKHNARCGIDTLGDHQRLPTGFYLRVMLCSSPDQKGRSP